MARTISTKLAVEGETQYKQAIAACNSELSTLKSDLALVESEFRGNANSMEALTAKGAALDSMYQKQREKVTTLEAALRNAQQAQEEYASRVSTAQSNIERCERSLETLRQSTGDTTAEQEALTKELDKWNAELEEAQAGQSAAERGAQNWQRQLNNAKVELNGLSDEIDKNNGYLDEARNSADGCADSIDEFGNEVDESKKGIEQLAAALAAAGVAKTVKEIADALMECAQAAEGFETSMAKVSTLADASVVPLESLKAQFLELSSETGVAVGALAEAAYQALSAGVDTANVVDFIATATKTSVAGFTEASTAVDVLTTAINSYHMEGTEAERVASMLVKTQDEGKTSVGELAQNMGRIIPTAAAYNVSLGNLTTSYALLTKSGTNTAISTTNLSAMFDELGKNGSTVADILKNQTGKSFSELMASGANLGDVMTILSDSVDGDSTAFSNLWSSTTAGKAALSLLNTGAEEFNRTLEVMENSSGAVERNFQIMADTTEFTHQRMTNAAENLKIAIGDQLNPALEKLYATGADAFTWATDLINENPWIVSAIAGVTAAIGALVIGVTALSAGPAIINALNTALLLLEANPIVLAAAAIVGLTVAIGAWVAASEDVHAITKNMTESLEATKAACNGTVESTTAAANVAERYISKLEEMGDYAALSAEEQREYHNILAILCETIPDLAEYIDLETNSIEGGTAALRAQTEAWKENAIAQAYQEQLTEMYKAQADVLITAEANSIRLTAAEAEREEVEKRLNEATERQIQLRLEAEEAARKYNEENGTSIEVANWLTQEYYGLKDTISELNNEWADANQIVEHYEGVIVDAAEATALAESEIELAEQAVRNLTGAEEDTVAPTQEMTHAVEGLIAEMENLAASYEESYNAAMTSIEGQIGLFQEMDGSAKTSIDNLIGTLQGQVSYMETYAANIQKAMELGVDEGLIRKLSDGSEESAQILAAIVEGGEEDIAALNEQLAKVEEGKEAFAETVAEMEADFSNQMDELVRDLDNAIQDMDLSDDTYIIGENNMQGLIDGTASKRVELVSKYAEMGRAALAAYKREVDQASPSKKFREAGRFDIQGIINGAELEKENLAETYADAGRTALSAMERSLPSSVEEPPTSAALNGQTAAIVAAVQSGGASGGIAIYIDKLEVRDDQDVERVARELYYLTEQKKRARGGGSL